MLGFFPTPYPGELLYSMIARYCERMQFPSHRPILHELLDTNNITAGIDLPGNLDFFVARLPPGHQYSADSIIDRHTLLPLYAPFVPPTKLTLIRESMKQGAR